MVSSNNNLAGTSNQNFGNDNKNEAVYNLLDDENEWDYQSDGRSSRSRRDADRNRVVTSCKQKVVSVCSTKNEVVVQAGTKTSCVRVPTYR